MDAQMGEQFSLSHSWTLAARVCSGKRLRAPSMNDILLGSAAYSLKCTGHYREVTAQHTGTRPTNDVCSAIAEQAESGRSDSDSAKKKRQVMQLCKSKTMAFILEATVPHIGTSLVAQKGRIGERRLEKILQSAVSWERNARLPVNAPLCPHHCHTAPQGLANLAAKHFLFKRTGNSHVISLLDTPLVHSG